MPPRWKAEESTWEEIPARASPNQSNSLVLRRMVRIHMRSKIDLVMPAWASPWPIATHTQQAYVTIFTTPIAGTAKTWQTLRLGEITRALRALRIVSRTAQKAGSISLQCTWKSIGTSTASREVVFGILLVTPGPLNWHKAILQVSVSTEISWVITAAFLHPFHNHGLMNSSLPDGRLTLCKPSLMNAKPVMVTTRSMHAWMLPLLTPTTRWMHAPCRPLWTSPPGAG